jgi:cytidylate kinase
MNSTNIALCGLTAAGKTTHAKLLAKDLGYRYVSGTATLARLCGLEFDDDAPRWLDIGPEIEARRHDGIDALLEDELVRLSCDQDAQVFDVWALPWTSEDPSLLRIWLESDRASRAAKCYVSQLEEASRDLAECASVVDAKDQANRDLFRRTVGFDLFVDHDVFNVVLDNSSFITAPTREAADRGIAAFAPIVQTATRVAREELDFAELAALQRACSFTDNAVIRLSISHGDTP